MAASVIEPEKIRRQLEDLWIGHGGELGEPGGVTRACALTLIAVVEEDGPAGALAETLGGLARRHPSRTLVVRLAAGGEETLQADVEAQCWMPFGQRRQICSEQIVIRCSEATLAEVPGVILPLVTPDLPVVLWCPSWRAFGSGMIAPLAMLAGRIILDTARAPRSPEAIRVLAAEARRRAGIADLSWTRLTRYRTQIAEVFGNARNLGRITQLSAATIDCHGPSPSSEALLLAGWLHLCLSWPVDGRVRFHRADDAGAGLLAAVEFGGSSEPPIRVDLTGAEEDSSETALLSEELGIEGRDRVFEQSLEYAARIAETAAPP